MLPYSLPVTHNTTGMKRAACQQEQQTSDKDNEKAKEKRKHCNWIRRCHKNQPQWNALGAAFFIFVSGGMSQAWAAGFAAHSMHMNLLTPHMSICWYGAAFVGAVVSASLTHRIPQRPVYFFSSCLVLVCGVLFLTLPERSAAIIAARYLDGLANGMVFVPALSTVGELSVCEVRGVLAASVEQLSYNFGIFLLLLYTGIWQAEWNATMLADQLHGLLCIICSVLALIFTLTCCVESPIFLLLRRSEQDTVFALRHLQRPFLVTNQTFLLLDEHKDYVATSRELSRQQNLQYSLLPLLKTSVYRALHALSLTAIVWSALFETAFELTSRYFNWPYAIFGTLRLSGCLCGIFVIESAGRKKPTLFSIFACGAFAVAFPTLLARVSNMTSALVILFSFQFFAGWACAASAVYLTEAFPLAVKPFCVALVYNLELLIRLGFSSYTPTQANIAIYFYVFCGISVAFFILGIFCLPETKCTNLAKAQIKIRTLFNEDF